MMEKIRRSAVRATFDIIDEINADHDADIGQWERGMIDGRLYELVSLINTLVPAKAGEIYLSDVAYKGESRTRNLARLVLVKRDGTIAEVKREDLA